MKRRELVIHLSIPEAPKHPRVMALVCTDERINRRRAQYRYGKIESALFFPSGAYRGSNNRETWYSERYYYLRGCFPLSHSNTWWLAEQWTLLSCKNYPRPDCHALRNQVFTIAAEKSEWEKYAPGLPGKRAWNGSVGHPGSWKVHWTKKY